MSLSLYMDVNVQRPVTDTLRVRGVDVLTAADEGNSRLPDPMLLDRATTLGRVLYTQDKDFLVEAARRQQAGVFFAGVIFSRQQTVTVRRQIDDLELLAKVYDPPDMASRVVYLPI